MWAKGEAAAETAAAEDLPANSALLQVVSVWCPGPLAPLAARTCGGRLQVLMTLPFFLQMLLYTHPCSPSIRYCGATGPHQPHLEVSPRSGADRGGQHSAIPAETPETAVGVAFAARSFSPVTLKWGDPRTAAQSPLVSRVDDSQREKADSFNASVLLRQQRGNKVGESALFFVSALNFLLESAKQEVPPSETSVPTENTANEPPESWKNWPLRSAEPGGSTVTDATSTPKNNVLAKRPVWLLPTDRPSLLTRTYMRPRESGSCPAVGGFGHPVGREFQELESWDKLLCRSGGVLSRGGPGDLAYKMLVLVKGYRGGDAPLGENLSAADDDFSSSADTIYSDNISDERNGHSELFHGISNRFLSGNMREGLVEAEHQGRGQPTDTSSKVAGPSYRKTEAELEGELNDVVDLLNMLHCHLTNVVDLRHPANVQLYANLRRIGLLRSSLLRQGKKANWQFSVPLVAPLGLKANEFSVLYGRQAPPYPSNGSDELDIFADEQGVMRGQDQSTVSGQSAAPYSPRYQAKKPEPTFLRSSSSYSPRGRELKEGVENATFKLEVMPESQHHTGTSLPPFSSNGGFRAATQEATEAPSSTTDDLEDDSGPVLVVLEDLSTPEQLFFGAKEIREFLFGQLLQTAYEIRAYNEFKQSLLTWAQQKRGIRYSEMKPGLSGEKIGLNRRDPLRDLLSPDERSLLTAAAAVASTQGEDTPAKHQEIAKGSDLAGAQSIGSSPGNSKTKSGSLRRKFSASDWLQQRKVEEQGHIHSGEAVADQAADYASRGAREISTPTGGLRITDPAGDIRASQPTHLSAERKEEKPWWVPLGLRFDLYVSFASITSGRIFVSPTAALLRLLSEPRIRTLVCVYNYDDPKTDIPPILRGNSVPRLPALVLGHRVITGARNIDRLLLSIVEYKPSKTYSLKQYAPRFLVKEPVFSEVLATAK